jgi:hypothetical protein
VPKSVGSVRSMSAPALSSSSSICLVTSCSQQRMCAAETHAQAWLVSMQVLSDGH